MARRGVGTEDLSARLEELTAVVAAQQAEIAALRAGPPDRTAPDAPGTAADRATPVRANRRDFLLLAGAAAVGAAGVAVACEAAPAGAATSDPYPQYVSDTGDTITGKLTVTGARSPEKATEIGNGYGGLTSYTQPGVIELGSKDGRPVRLGAQVRWESDDDDVAGTHLGINKPAVVLRQTDEDHKGALIEFQQQLDAGAHHMGVATNTPGAVFDVPVAGPKRIGWITADYDSPNPVDGIHQHMNFETCKADLTTIVTRLQISWGEDVALISFPNSNVRVVQSGKTLSFGSNSEVRAVYDSSGRLVFGGKPVSFAPHQLQVDGDTVRPVLFARKPADETVTGTTSLHDDGDLAVALTPNAIYTCTLFLVWSSDAAADLKVAWTAPGDATVVWSPDAFGTAATSSTSAPKQSVAGTDPVALGGVGTGTKLAMAATGIVRTGATGGPLRLRWAQNSARSLPTTVYRDSFLQLTRMT